MEITIAFLISLIANIATESGRSILQKIGNKTIIKNIENAFEKALEKWAKNEGARNYEKIFARKHIELFKEILLQYNTKPEDKNLIELLDLFKIELMSDPIANNFLSDLYHQDLIKRHIRIEYKIDEISSVQNDILSKVSTISKELREVKENVLFPEEKAISLSYTHFVENLKPEDIYIPRTVTDYQNINKEYSLFDETKGDKQTLYELIEQESRIVILGSAGTGKSVELKETAIAIANHEKYYPIFLALNLYTPDDTLENFLPDDFISIPENKIIVFLDGLDEIEPAKFLTVKRRVLKFSEDYKDVKVVISCRTNFYDLPSGKNSGTLRGFMPYYLNDLTLSDIKKFISDNYRFNADKFIDAVYVNNLYDLVINPFFLKLIIQNYIDNDFKGLKNRAEIIRGGINARIDLDINHYSETVDLENDKHKAITFLRKIALAMEIVGTRIIKDEDLRTIIPESDDYKLIKYCTVFKKEEGDSGNWKFEHNYFQEFLCAELLAKYNFDTVKLFMAYDDYDKVLPSWFNTVAQLISILDESSDLFKQLTNWIIDNDIEVLVNVEREKLLEQSRNEIFKKIFDHFKELKIWIDSNKFRYEDLAYFGQSEKSIDYILSIVINKNEERIVRINALNVLGSFSVEQYQNIDVLKNSLIEILKHKENDTSFISNVLNVFTKHNFIDNETVKTVFDILGKLNSENVRAAMFRFLQGSVVFENYVDYFIQGYKILSGPVEGREKNNLLEEKTQLIEGIRKFKSKEAIVKIIEFCMTDSNDLERDYRSDEIFSNLINNCIDIFYDDESIYDQVFELMKYYSKYWIHNISDIVIIFFQKTKTVEKAFNDTLELIKQSEFEPFLIKLLSYFINEKNYDDIIVAYNNENIHDDFIKSLYFQIQHSKPALAESYKLKLQNESGFEIEIPEIPDWDKINRERTQKSFDLLFHIDKFKEECLRIFGDEDELSKKELWEYSKFSKMEEKYINSALDIVREFAKNTPAKKTDVIDWLSTGKNYEYYMINSVYEYIKNKEQLNVGEQQVMVIKDWYDEYVEKIDFKKAITMHEDGNFSTNRYAQYLAYFMKKFSFECNENILLDMLSFVSEGNGAFKTIELDYIISNIKDKKIINNRIVENINGQKLAKFSVYELHVKYALENNLFECYPAIIEDLVKSNDKSYKKNMIIDMYIDSGSNVSLLKEVFDELGIDMQLHLTKRLLQKENEFVIEKLTLLDKSDYDTDTKRIINNQLIKSGQILGLTNSIKWIKENNKSPFSQHGHGLAHFKDIESLPYLMELLELSYNKDIKTNNELDRMWSIVVDGLEYLALSSFDNFEAVLKKMKLFIEDNKGILENVEFLNRPIEIIKQNYYNSITVEFNFEDAKRKVEELTA